MTEKAQTARGDGQRDPKYKQVVHVRREHHPAQRGRQRHTARNAVDAIHEVVGVREADDPQKRDDDSHDAQLQFTDQRNGDCFEVSQPINRDRCDESLHRKTEARRKRCDIIAPAKPRYDESTREKDQTAAPTRFILKPESCSRDDGNDHQPTPARRRDDVRTAFVGVVYDLTSLGVAAYEVNAAVRKEREEDEDEELSHGNDCK